MNNKQNDINNSQLSNSEKNRYTVPEKYQNSENNKKNKIKKETHLQLASRINLNTN